MRALKIPGNTVDDDLTPVHPDAPLGDPLQGLRVDAVLHVQAAVHTEPREPASRGPGIPA